MTDADVIVIGGGPAGASAAWHAAGAGRRVVVLERSRFTRERLGETLDPKAVRGLLALGVNPAAIPHVQSPGVISLWDSSAEYENDFILQPGGAGWHVDRRALDAEMLRCAAAAGADVRVAKAEDFQREKELWTVTASDGEYRAPWLIDATGRAGLLRRRLRIAARTVDDLVAVYRRGPRPHADHRLAVEAVEDGWWYTAPLPDGRGITAWLNDAADVPRDPQALETVWRASLNRTRIIAPRAVTVFDDPLHTTGAGMQYAETLAGDGWLLVGDCGFAFDPLAGAGVQHALDSGRQILDVLNGRSEDLNDTHRDFVARQLAERARLYALVRHWPDAPFWQRRRH